MKKIIIPAILICLVIGGYVATRLIPNQKDEDMSVATTTPSEQGSSTIVGDATFEWEYSSYEKEEIPRTIISLTARDSAGGVSTKQIDDIEGSCNRYEESDSDMYQGSSMIICYYAGLGHYYKVVKQDGGYAVQRKTFEEASPDYDPPQEPFKTIVIF